MDSVEDRARQAIEAELGRIDPDEAVEVRLWDDEWEQWHVDTYETPGTVSIPLRAARAYAFAKAVWDEAQGVVSAAVDTLEQTFPEEARDHGWHHELFRGDLTRAELDARLEPCPHPPEARHVTKTARMESTRCVRCRQFVGNLTFKTEEEDDG